MLFRSSQMPIYTGFVTVAFFAAIGLPSLSGFISEILVFLGAFSVASIRVLTIISTLTVVLGAAYMLWTLQRIFFGKLNEKWSSLHDLTGREYAMFIPLLIIVFYLGIYPNPMIHLMNTSVNSLIEFMSANAQHITALAGF